MQTENQTDGGAEKSATATIYDMTDDQRSRAMQCWRCIREGVDVPLTHAEMLELESLKLVRDLTTPTGRGCKAKRYTFFHTEKLEDLCKILSLERTILALTKQPISERKM